MKPTLFHPRRQAFSNGDSVDLHYDANPLLSEQYNAISLEIIAKRSKEVKKCEQIFYIIYLKA